MNRDDDAERRIRELERPLADAAQISELGTGTAPNSYPQPPGYYPPPPPPGAPYPGSSWTGMEPRPSRGMRVGWIVLSVIIVALVLGGVGIFVNQFASTTRSLINPSIKPPVAGGGGTFTTRPTTRSSAPSREASPEVPAPHVDTESMPSADGTISVAGMGQNRTFTCHDSAVTVSGVRNTVVLHGHCTHIDVSGVENIVTVDSADAIAASGMQNRVTFHSGSPEVSQSGFSNSVEQG